ncbi:uncharacterized protein LOC133320169 [Danaus plexippus]|uniref:uncharacterized protein LOC133320169 n=1 Tax=Danaus plexippus TaxID=13037 RepID=UPI002AB2AD07|nr:uncharacterized protein LOC133320169 [Danaus plexippus]
MMKQVLLALATCSIYTVYCRLEIIPERVTVNYINEKHFYNYSIKVQRASRSSSYFLNIEMTTKQQWNNNVSIHLIFNEFLHNEYRRSVIEMHFKYCDSLKDDKFIGAVFQKLGFKCPIPAGTKRIKNVNLSLEDFPNVFPIQKSRIDVECLTTDTNETMLRVYFYITFKNHKS